MNSEKINKRVSIVLKSNPNADFESVKRLLLFKDRAKNDKYFNYAPRHGFTIKQICDILEGKLILPKKNTHEA